MVTFRYVLLTGAGGLHHLVDCTVTIEGKKSLTESIGKVVKGFCHSIYTQITIMPLLRKEVRVRRCIRRFFFHDFMVLMIHKDNAIA